MLLTARCCANCFSATLVVYKVVSSPPTFLPSSPIRKIVPYFFPTLCPKLQKFIPQYRLPKAYTLCFRRSCPSIDFSKLIPSAQEDPAIVFPKLIPSTSEDLTTTLPSKLSPQPIPPHYSLLKASKPPTWQICCAASSPTTSTPFSGSSSPSSSWLSSLQSN
jgi:hypothetical protein